MSTVSMDEQNACEHSYVDQAKTSQAEALCRVNSKEEHLHHGVAYITGLRLSQHHSGPITRRFYAREYTNESLTTHIYIKNKMHFQDKNIGRKWRSIMLYAASIVLGTRKYRSKLESNNEISRE